MRKSESVEETSNKFSLENDCQSSNLLKNLLDIIESHPSEAAIKFGRSIIYFIVKDYNKTLNCLEFLTEKYPEVPLFHQRIAEVLIRNSNYEKASHHLEKVLEFDQENLTAKVWLCLSYFKLCHIEKAHKMLADLNNFVFLLKVTEINYNDLDS